MEKESDLFDLLEKGNFHNINIHEVMYFMINKENFNFSFNKKYNISVKKNINKHENLKHIVFFNENTKEKLTYTQNKENPEPEEYIITTSNEEDESYNLLIEKVLKLKKLSYCTTTIKIKEKADIYGVLLDYYHTQHFSKREDSFEIITKKNNSLFLELTKEIMEKKSIINGFEELNEILKLKIDQGIDLKTYDLIKENFGEHTLIDKTTDMIEKLKNINEIKTKPAIIENREFSEKKIAERFIKQQLKKNENELLMNFFNNNINAKKEYLKQIEEEVNKYSKNISSFNTVIKLTNDAVKTEKLILKKTHETKEGVLSYEINFSEDSNVYVEFFTTKSHDPSFRGKEIINIKLKDDKDFLIQTKRVNSNITLFTEIVDKETEIEKFITRLFDNQLSEENTSIKENLSNLKDFIDHIHVLKNSTLNKLPNNMLYEGIFDDIDLLNVKKEEFDLIKLKTDINIEENIEHVKSYINRMNKNKNKFKI